MHDSDSAVAIFAVIVIFGGPIAWSMANRSFAHKERMAMIERGLVPPDVSPRDMRAARRAGFAPMSGAMPAADFDYAEYQANRMLHKGVTVGMLGLALFIGLSFIRPGQPGPWLLGGLVPMFIGIAQIIVAVLSGARLGPAPRYQQPPPQAGQPSAPGAYQQSAPPPRDVTPGPYAWRPGAATELERPPSPPDER